jgi:hypothetical protein
MKRAFAALALITVCVLLLLGDEGQTASESTSPNACNGHVELCNRPYDEVAFPASHNSMDAADQGWVLPEQPNGIVRQLDAGIRVFLIDSWYGQPTSRPGHVATAEGDKAAAEAELNAELGPDVVAAALRDRNATSQTPNGAVRPYLCHGLCELGAVLWETEMTEVRTWVVAHPRDVITFFIQDEVTPTDTNAVFRAAGLLPYVHAQPLGQPWPTLGQLIDSGQRVVVFMENHGGGRRYPWLMQGFDYVQDTPYDNPRRTALSCSLERGSPDNSILLVNHWVDGPGSLVRDARKANAEKVLLPQMRECEQERGQLPNFVAVNYYNLGDLFPVVDELNGVPR